MRETQDTAPPGILVAGESLIDIVEHQGREPVEHVGGSPANVALGLARLGNPVELRTWFGSDTRGERIRAWLETDGVIISAGSQGANRTSTAHARIDAAGAADYVFDFAYDVPDVDPVRPPAHIHIGSISAIREPGATKTMGMLEEFAPTATISYDPNVRPQVMPDPVESRRRVEALIKRVDVVKISDEDISWLSPDEDVAETLHAWLMLGPALVILTRGAEGSLALSAGGAKVSVPATLVTVADTVGAGDSFMAGLIDGLAHAGLLGTHQREALRAIDEDTLREVLQRAATIAAITVSRAGANPPTAEELTLTPLRPVP